MCLSPLHAPTAPRTGAKSPLGSSRSGAPPGTPSRAPQRSARASCTRPGGRASSQVARLPDSGAPRPVAGSRGEAGAGELAALRRAGHLQNDAGVSADARRGVWGGHFTAPEISLRPSADTHRRSPAGSALGGRSRHCAPLPGARKLSSRFHRHLRPCPKSSQHDT